MAEHHDLDDLQRHEELLEKREERLQTAHKRRMEVEPDRNSGKSGGGLFGKPHGSSGGGGGFGTIIADLGEHKIIFAIIGVGIVGAIILYNVYKNNSASGTATANSSPDLAAGGYLPSDISAQLASINQQLSGLGSGQGTGGTPAPPVPPPTAAPVNMANQPNGGVYENINSGVMHYVATGSQTLSQIAAQFGLDSWNSIYAIPENQQILGRMSGSTARGYTPKAGLSIVLPGSSIPESGWFEVGGNSASNQNSLASISQLEGISLNTINSLNPQLATYTGTLLPGTEVRYK